MPSQVTSVSDRNDLKPWKGTIYYCPSIAEDVSASYGVNDYYLPFGTKTIPSGTWNVRNRDILRPGETAFISDGADISSMLSRSLIAKISFVQPVSNMGSYVNDVNYEPGRQKGDIANVSYLDGHGKSEKIDTLPLSGYTDTFWTGR